MDGPHCLLMASSCKGQALALPVLDIVAEIALELADELLDQGFVVRCAPANFPRLAGGSAQAIPSPSVANLCKPSWNNSLHLGMYSGQH